MTKEELQSKLQEINPSISFEEGTEWLTARLESNDWLPFAEKLKNTAGLDFDYLFCITCIDWKTHLSMVYHLTSTRHRHTIVVKSNLDRTNPGIQSVAHLWRTAEFHEREQYEMFGVNFINHPDLRLLILPDGWEGKYPMRKDFEDPINMIKL